MNGSKQTQTKSVRNTGLSSSFFFMHNIIIKEKNKKRLPISKIKTSIMCVCSQFKMFTL